MLSRLSPRISQKVPPASGTCKEISKTLEVFVQWICRPTHQLYSPGGGRSTTLGVYCRFADRQGDGTNFTLMSIPVGTEWYSNDRAAPIHRRCFPTVARADTQPTLLLDGIATPVSANHPLRAANLHARRLGTVASRAQRIQTATSPSGQPTTVWSRREANRLRHLAECPPCGRALSEQGAGMHQPRINPDVGTPVPAVMSTCSTSGTGLTDVPRN
jgi:hypothetical protein